MYLQEEGGLRTQQGVDTAMHESFTYLPTHTHPPAWSRSPAKTDVLYGPTPSQHYTECMPHCCTECTAQDPERFPRCYGICVLSSYCSYTVPGCTCFDAQIDLLHVLILLNSTATEPLLRFYAESCGMGYMFTRLRKELADAAPATLPRRDLPFRPSVLQCPPVLVWRRRGHNPGGPGDSRCAETALRRR